MKQKKLKTILLFFTVISFINCEKETIFEQGVNLAKENNKTNTETVSFEEAISFFETKKTKNTSSKISKKLSPLIIDPDWNSLNQNDLPNTEALLTSAQSLINRKGNYNSKLFFIKVNGEMKNVIYTIYKDSVDLDDNIINARFFLNDLNGNYIDGYKIENASILKQYAINSTSTSKSSLLSKSSITDPIEDCWNTDTLDLYENGQLPIIVIFGTNDSGTSSSTNNSTSTTTGFYSTSGDDSSNGYGTQSNYGNNNTPKLTNKNIEEIAGAITVEPDFITSEMNYCPSGYFPNENGNCFPSISIDISSTTKIKNVVEELKMF